MILKITKAFHPEISDLKPITHTHTKQKQNLGCYLSYIFFILPKRLKCLDNVFGYIVKYFEVENIWG